MPKHKRRVGILVALLISMGLFSLVLGPSMTGYFGVNIPEQELRIQQMPDFSIAAGQAFNYNILAEGGKTPLRFFDDTALFDINESIGVISFTPDLNNRGTHVIKLTVTDTDGREAIATFTLIIR